MINFTPYIRIWNLELRDKKSERIIQNLYFLSYKRAMKFIEKNDAEIYQCHWILGDEQLWLW